MGWLSIMKAFYRGNNKLLIIFGVRAVLGLWIAQTTEFVPDEFWQSTEVAYQRTFGKGHLTWEWTAAIRSSVFPSIIANIYWMGNQLSMISPWFLTFIPQLGLCLMSLFSMYCFHDYVWVHFNRKVARYTMYLLGVNWFTVFCDSRLLANQIEMNFNCISLYYLYVKKGFWSNMMLTVLLTANFLIRPTAGIFWAPYAVDLVKKFLFVKYLAFIPACFITGLSVAAWICYMDFTWYKEPVFTFWEFFRFNFLQRGNAEFGVHGPFWYLYSGIPSIFGPLVLILPFVFKASRKVRNLSLKILPYVVMYSILDHKEIRFLLPAVPIMCLLLANLLSEIEDDLKAISLCGIRCSRHSIRKSVMWGLLALNLSAVIMIGLNHQKGIKPAAKFVHAKMIDIPFPRTWLMMPCYSFPANTYMHNPRADFKFYVCAPKRFREQLNQYEDNFVQKNGFDTVNIMRDIKKKLMHSFPPHFVITYEKVESTVKYAFRRQGYIYFRCARYRHTYFGDFHRFVVVLCASPLNLHGGRLGGYLKGT